MSAVILFFNATATTELYTLSLHDALPISRRWPTAWRTPSLPTTPFSRTAKHSRARLSPSSRSEEHTSELQSLRHLVCRLLLEKKKSMGSGRGARCVDGSGRQAPCCAAPDW